MFRGGHPDHHFSVRDVGIAAQKISQRTRSRAFVGVVAAGRTSVDPRAFANTFFRADYRSLDDETRIDLLIDNLVPWYFQFVASWSLAEKQGRLDICWLSYEELIKDKPASITNVLKFYGLGAPLRGIEHLIRETESEKRKSRFNKGIAGRGEAKLSESQKDRIRRYSRYFPTTDFSRIGL